MSSRSITAYTILTNNDTWYRIIAIWISIVLNKKTTCKIKPSGYLLSTNLCNIIHVFPILGLIRFSTDVVLHNISRGLYIMGEKPQVRFFVGRPKNIGKCKLNIWITKIGSPRRIWPTWSSKPLKSTVFPSALPASKPSHTYFSFILTPHLHPICIYHQ